MIYKRCIISLEQLLDFQEDESGIIRVEGIRFHNDVNLAGLFEVFTRKDYEFGGLTDCVFIDVGANIGDSALYAANHPNISKVYAYEPFKKVYDMAVSNINLNPQLARKIEIFNYAWNDVGGSITVNEVDDINDSAVNTIDESFEKICYRSRNHSVSVDCKNASEIFGVIKEKHPNQKIILKMDVEGAEYKCFEDLEKNGKFKDIDIVFVEWHFQDCNQLISILEKNNFIWFNEGLSDRVGLIRAFRKQK